MTPAWDVIHGDLFSGIGGFALAARWMGWRTAWFSEIEPYACRVLAKHWPDVPNVGDITTADWSAVERVDILTGGFPCQDISSAGKKVGITGERSGLWGAYARAIRDLRPRYVVVENVADLAHRGLDRVLGDLADLGYDAEWQMLSAAQVGAPHRRPRLWVVAHADSAGRGRLEESDGPSPHGRCVEAPPRGDAHGLGVAQHRAWDGDPRTFGVADGLSRGVDAARRAACGNAIVPQCALVIFRAIAEAEAQWAKGAA